MHRTRLSTTANLFCCLVDVTVQNLGSTRIAAELAVAAGAAEEYAALPVVGADKKPIDVPSAELDDLAAAAAVVANAYRIPLPDDAFAAGKNLATSTNADVAIDEKDVVDAAAAVVAKIHNLVDHVCTLPMQIVVSRYLGTQVSYAESS